MLLEWLRRNDAEFSTHLRTFLFSQGPIREAAGGGGGGGGGEESTGSLSIGSLKG